MKNKCSVFLKILTLIAISSTGPCLLFALYELVVYHKVIYGKSHPIMIVMGSGILLSIIIAGLIAKDITSPIKTLVNAIKNYRQNKIKQGLSQIGRCDEFGYLFSEFDNMVEEIEKYQERLAKTAQLVAIGEIVNQIAHDLRNPLNMLQYSLDKIKEMGGVNGEVINWADSGRKACDRIELMADDLLDYKKARQLQVARVYLDKLIDDSVKDVLAQAEEKGVKINTCLPPKMVLNIDAGKLQRVIANIVLNAVQAIKHENGTIEIKGDSPLSEGGLSPFVITIKDNGAGIKPEHLAKIFDPSFTFGKIGGTGLGLAYSQQVIEAHGGTIKVESEVGNGTRFIITLPADVVVEGRGDISQKAENITSVSSPEEAPASQPETISSSAKYVLIDDDYIVRSAWGFMAQKAGKSFQGFSSSTDFFKNLDIIPKSSLIYIDSNLADGLPGEDIAKKLHELGFPNLYIASGYEKERFSHLTFLKGIQRKDPPF